MSRQHLIQACLNYNFKAFVIQLCLEKCECYLEIYNVAGQDTHTQLFIIPFSNFISNMKQSRTSEKNLFWHACILPEDYLLTVTLHNAKLL